MKGRTSKGHKVGVFDDCLISQKVMREIVYITLVVMLCSCQMFEFDEDKTPIASVGEAVLYMEDIQHLIDAENFDGDTATLIKKEVEKWATAQLLYNLACNNISNSSDIEKMVEEYRQSLYIHSYQQKFTEQSVAMPTEQDAKACYEENKGRFVQDELLVKGIYIAFPKKMKDGAKLKTALKKFKPGEGAEKIEKLAFQNMISYDYFVDEWVGVSNLEKQINGGDKELKVNRKKKYYEYSDSVNTHLLYVADVIMVGEESPFEYVKEHVKEILYKQHKMQFIRDFGPQVYREAEMNGEIKYY